MGIHDTTLVESLPAGGAAAAGFLEDSRSEQWPDCVDVLGLRITPFRFEQALDAIEYLIDQSRPAFIITANTQYATLTARNARLQAVNRQAAFVVADGMPLVWAARLAGRTIPQRVTGADLLPAMCGRAAERGFRVFLLGAREGVGERAAHRLQSLYPGLQIAGVEWPDISRLSPRETAQLERRIRNAKTDLLFTALSQPFGELWLAEHFRNLGNTVCCQSGASLDFMAGEVRRAPLWMRRSGLEWSYRLYREPGRLASRYADNAFFLAKAAIACLPGLRGLGTRNINGAADKTPAAPRESSAEWRPPSKHKNGTQVHTILRSGSGGKRPR